MMILYLFIFQTCPLLLRVFCNNGRHHNIMEYSRGNVPSNELQIYTWYIDLCDNGEIIKFNHVIAINFMLYVLYFEK